MRSLLDVNVCIALLDSNHVFHEKAHAWWGSHAKQGWASCPLTENGVVRIMSSAGYSKDTRFSIAELIDRLQTFARQTNHEFWPDELSLLDNDVFVREHLHSSSRLTDNYLLALATYKKGRLATFDDGISAAAVKKAKPLNLVHI